MQKVSKTQIWYTWDEFVGLLICFQISFFLKVRDVQLHGFPNVIQNYHMVLQISEFYLGVTNYTSKAGKVNLNDSNGNLSEAIKISVNPG